MNNKTGINRKTEDDIKKISEAMDALAKILVAKKQDGTQLRLEYELKLKKLNNLIHLLIGMKEDKDICNYELDTDHLDRIFRNDIEIVERVSENSDGKSQIERFALIPIHTQSKDDNASPNRKKKKKKNKICCSFCNEQGHTRAKCEKRLLYPK